ncbi:MAG: VOC family protein, partial [Lysobacterales bacterium]
YGGLFGWTFRDAEHPGGEGPYTVITSGDQYVGGMLQLDDPGDADYSRWLGYVSVGDVNEAVAWTRAEGGRVVAGPVDLGAAGRAAAVIDPQGAVVGLLRSRLGDPDDSRRPVDGQVVWDELLAADDQAAARFYSGLAGYRTETLERGGGEYLMLMAQGRERAGVMQRPDERLQPLWLTHFAVEDPVATTRRVKELGGKVLLAPAPGLRDGRLAVVEDPTGAILALHQWPEPQGTE